MKADTMNTNIFHQMTIEGHIRLPFFALDSLCEFLISILFDFILILVHPFPKSSFVLDYMKPYPYQYNLYKIEQKDMS